MDLARPAAAGLARLGLRPDLCRSGLGQPRGPVPCGQSGPREDRRGSPRCAWFAALCRALWPCGLRVGARAWMRYAAEPPRAQPRLRSALIPTRYAVGTRLRASFKSVDATDFQRRLSVRTFSGHFSASFRRSGPLHGPRACISSQKWPQKALQGRRQLVRQPPDHLLFGGLACQARTHDRAWHRPDRAERVGTGVGPCGPPRLRSLNPRTLF